MWITSAFDLLGMVQQHPENGIVSEYEMRRSYNVMEDEGDGSGKN